LLHGEPLQRIQQETRRSKSVASQNQSHYFILQALQPQYLRFTRKKQNGWAEIQVRRYQRLVQLNFAENIQVSSMGP